MASQNGHASILAQIKFSKIKYPSTKFTHRIMYWAIFYLNTIYGSVEKVEPVSVSSFFCSLPKTQFFIFTYQKSSLFVGKFLCINLSNRGYISKKRVLSYFSSIKKSILSSKSHHFKIWQENITHSIIANIIVLVHKLGKHNRKRPDMTNNILTVPVSI